MLALIDGPKPKSRSSFFKADRSRVDNEINKLLFINIKQIFGRKSQNNGNSAVKTQLLVCRYEGARKSSFAPKN